MQTKEQLKENQRKFYENNPDKKAIYQKNMRGKINKL